MSKFVTLVALLAALVLSGCGSAADPMLMGDQQTQRVTDHDAGGQAEAFQFTARRSGRVTHASVYIARGSRANRVVVGIYTTTSTRPAHRRGHRKAKPDRLEAKPGRLITSGSLARLKAGRWDDVPLAPAHLAKGERYWVALLGVRGRLSFRDARAGTVSYRSKQTRLAALPATFSPGARARSGPASVYIDGIAGAAIGSGTTPGSSGSGSGSPGSGSTAPTHQPVQTCTGTPNIPGGPDPWGGCFPGPNNTGVPAGTTLTTIGSSGSGWKFSGGNLDITGCGVALNAVTIPGTVYLEASASNGTHSASTPCVTISNSEIDGWVDVGSTDGSQAGGPLVLTDDTVDVPNSDDDRSPVLSSNYYADGLNVEGGRLGFSCQSGYCDISNSWAHAGYLEGEFHYNAIGSNGASNMDFEHNSLACDFQDDNQTAINNGAGCSDDIGLFGDFAQINNVTVNKNLFVSDAQAYGSVPFCFDGGGQTGKAYPTPTNESVTNNVFQRGSSHKCGQYGPVYSWTPGNGNSWSGNTWDDGTALAPPS